MHVHNCVRLLYTMILANPVSAERALREFSQVLEFASVIDQGYALLRPGSMRMFVCRMNLNAYSVQPHELPGHDKSRAMGVDMIALIQEVTHSIRRVEH